VLQRTSAPTKARSSRPARSRAGSASWGPGHCPSRQGALGQRRCQELQQQLGMGCWIGRSPTHCRMPRCGSGGSNPTTSRSHPHGLPRDRPPAPEANLESSLRSPLMPAAATGRTWRPAQKAGGAADSRQRSHEVNAHEGFKCFAKDLAANLKSRRRSLRTLDSCCASTVQRLGLLGQAHSAQWSRLPPSCCPASGSRVAPSALV